MFLFRRLDSLLHRPILCPKTRDETAFVADPRFSHTLTHHSFGGILFWSMFLGRKLSWQWCGRIFGRLDGHSSRVAGCDSQGSQCHFAQGGTLSSECQTELESAQRRDPTAVGGKFVWIGSQEKQSRIASALHGRNYPSRSLVQGRIRTITTTTTSRLDRNDHHYDGHCSHCTNRLTDWGETAKF